VNRDFGDGVMGLSRLEIGFFCTALKMGLLPSGGHILELGESQLLPNSDASVFLAMLTNHIDPKRLQETTSRIESAIRSKSKYQQVFGPAREIYQAIFEPATYTAIDLDSGPRRYCLDLNGPISLPTRFDCVINNGTSEHLFNQANVFRVIHDHTCAGGVMIHWTPCLGWINHGLYNVQPGFFFDLARANGYEALLVALACSTMCTPLSSPSYDEILRVLGAHPELNNSQVCAVLRKNSDAPFAMPLQGSYTYQSTTLPLAQMSREYRNRDQLLNLALGRPATQSSTSIWSWHDDPSIDAMGGNNGRVTGLYGFHTELEHQPWWMVDLGTILPLSEVVIYNRLDYEYCARRAAHLSVRISNNAENWRQVFTRTEDQGFGGADGQPLRVNIVGQSARYVQIQLPELQVLHLDEIQVY
jgi:hypothetical protein